MRPAHRACLICGRRAPRTLTYALCPDHADLAWLRGLVRIRALSDWHTSPVAPTAHDLRMTRPPPHTPIHWSVRLRRYCARNGLRYAAPGRESPGDAYMLAHPDWRPTDDADAQ